MVSWAVCLGGKYRQLDGSGGYYFQVFSGVRLLGRVFFGCVSELQKKKSHSKQEMYLQCGLLCQNQPPLVPNDPSRGLEFREITCHIMVPLTLFSGTHSNVLVQIKRYKNWCTQPKDKSEKCSVGR